MDLRGKEAQVVREAGETKKEGAENTTSRRRKKREQTNPECMFRP